MQSISKLVSNPTFDSESLKRYLLLSGELYGTRTYCFAEAKAWRNAYPLAFARVLKVSDLYFIITNENHYKTYWQARKLALLNERRMKK